MAEGSTERAKTAFLSETAETEALALAERVLEANGSDIIVTTASAKKLAAALVTMTSQRDNLLRKMESIEDCERRMTADADGARNWAMICGYMQGRLSTLQTTYRIL